MCKAEPLLILLVRPNHVLFCFSIEVTGVPYAMNFVISCIVEWLRVLALGPEPVLGPNPGNATY